MESDAVVKSPFDTLDTPEKAYWAGYMMLAASIASYTDSEDDLIVSSKEEGHLESLEELLPHGSIESIVVDSYGKEKVLTYWTFHVQDDGAVEFLKQRQIPPRIVRKFASHYIRGMLDARPPWEWSQARIDLDLPEEMAAFVLDYIPYLAAEHLNNGRCRLYTRTAFDTYRMWTYLYRNAPVAKTSRKSIYE